MFKIACEAWAVTFQRNRRVICLERNTTACNPVKGGRTYDQALAPRTVPALSIESVKVAVPRLINHVDPDTYAAEIIANVAATNPAAGQWTLLDVSNLTLRRVRRRLRYATGAT